jgi:hypothetical protein
MTTISNNSVLIISGGDDQSINISMIEIDKNGVLKLLFEKSIVTTHNSSIRGLDGM